MRNKHPKPGRQKRNEGEDDENVVSYLLTIYCSKNYNIASMQPSPKQSKCCSRWCRSPDNDKEDTWMEPCRSSAKSKRRSAENNRGDAHDSSDASQPLLGEEDGSASEDDFLTEPNSELCHSGSSFEAAIKAADATSSAGDNHATTAPMNNCSTSTPTKTKSSSKWRYPFSSGRRPIIDAMDILGKETVRGLKGAKLPSTPKEVLDGAENKFTKSSQKDGNSPSPTAASSSPITSIVLLENGLFVTASMSYKYIKLWKFKEEVVSVPPTQGKDDSEAQHDIDNNVGEHNQIEFICEFRGHVSGVTAMVKLDKRGRFLTASLDKTVKLWEIDCNKDDDGIKDGPNLLATFTNLDKRWIKVSNTAS